MASNVHSQDQSWQEARASDVAYAAVNAAMLSVAQDWPESL